MTTDPESADDDDFTQTPPSVAGFFFLGGGYGTLYLDITCANNAEQVLCNTTGWSLVFHKPDSRFHQPAFSLLACRTTMTAALVVRGTGSIQDVITDIQAMPVPFPAPRGDTGSGKTDVLVVRHGAI